MAAVWLRVTFPVQRLEPLRLCQAGEALLLSASKLFWMAMPPATARVLLLLTVVLVEFPSAKELESVSFPPLTVTGEKNVLAAESRISPVSLLVFPKIRGPP